jgi:hypothetical protein
MQFPNEPVLTGFVSDVVTGVAQTLLPGASSD